VSSPRTEFDLLLAAPTPVDAELAREILGEAGIPTFTHGRDRDFAELGAAIHSDLTRPDLYVPKGRRAEAEALLADAWDADSLSDEIALSMPREERDASTPLDMRRVWIGLVTAFVLIALAVAYYHEFILSRGASSR